MSKSVWRRPKYPLKGPREHQKRAKDGPRRLSRPSSAARSEQTRPKGVPGRIKRLSLVDLEARRSSQETTKSSQKELERAPKRFQNHLWIENDDLSKIELPPRRIKVFEGRRVSLGAQNRPQEAPRGDKKRYRKKKNEERRKKEHQERKKSFKKL